jgi:hypothetical protein
MDRFWHAEVAMFKAPEPSAEAVPGEPVLDGGYVFWPSVVALHALAAGEWHWRFVRGASMYRPQIAAVFAGLERYFDPARHAYNAWVAFSGNDDKYYDDNALAVVALVDCYEATQDLVYLDRAWEVMSGFVHGGWDSSGDPGGVRWGTDPTKPHTANRTVSATAFAALAAFRLAERHPVGRNGFDRDFNVGWGHAVLEWIWTTIRDPQDDLIRDGLGPTADGWEILPVKWTYNTGVPMRAYVEHHRLTGDGGSLSRAVRLADAAIDRGLKPLFDGMVEDPARNFWYDSTFFVHHLMADGLLEVVRATGQGGYWEEIRRQANYLFWYVRDADALYFRNTRLWLIDEARHELWEYLTGESYAVSEHDRDLAERAHNDTARTVKTLLANASMARTYWRIGLPASRY